MKNDAYWLDQARRRVVKGAILEICCKRGWTVRALHVREVHVHNVVHADVDPDAVLNAFKCRASLRLRKSGLDAKSIKRWARNGSKRRLWTEEDVNRAIEYVLYEQGEPMEVHPELNDEAGSKDGRQRHGPGRSAEKRCAPGSDWTVQGSEDGSKARAGSLR